MEETFDRFDVWAVGFDPWNSSDLTNRLMQDEAPLVEFRQGPKSFNPPMKTIDRAYKSKMIAHGGNPVLAWMASNVVARRDVNGNLAPDKKHSHEKIDGFVSFAMSVGLAMDEIKVNARSVYEERGIIVC